MSGATKEENEMMRNIFAHTAPENPYPEYLSINEEGGNITVTVRAAGTEEGTGPEATMHLPHDAATELYRALQRELLPTSAA